MMASEARVVTVDMCDGLIQGRNGFDRKDVGQVFCPVILLGRRHDAVNASADLFVPANLHLFFIQAGFQLRHQLIQDFFMDHQGFTGVTDADSLGLGVENDIHCHIKVCRLIHIDVTVSRAGLDDRYCAVLHHSP